MAVYKALRMVAGCRLVRVPTTAAGPSTMSDSAARGKGTTAPDQTTSPSPEAALALRAMTLPAAQDNAAASTIMSGTTGATKLRPTATSG